MTGSLKMEVFRGAKSREYFGTAFWRSFAVIQSLIGGRVLLILVDTAILVYLCFFSEWSQNKIVGLMSKWESKAERAVN
jgi:hypothetical protein